MGTKMRSALAGAAIASVAFAGVGVSAAGAVRPDDAPRGQVERGPDHARSICAFSGLNDEPDDPVEGGQVQSFGQIVKLGLKPVLDEMGETPGALCNPEKGIDLHGAPPA